jgi:glutamate racemase
MDACQKVVKGENFYYYGDNKRAPYGNLSQEKIRKYVFRAFKKFRKLHVCAVVIACNTVTAVCVEELRRKFSFPIIGAEPALLPAVREGGKVLVLTTRATFESVRFLKLQQRARECYPRADVECYPCAGLAGGIEKWIEDPRIDIERFLPNRSPDRVVLGCTHYLYVKEQISRFYGCETIDGNEGIARRLQKVLDEKNLAKSAQYFS